MGKLIGLLGSNEKTGKVLTIYAEERERMKAREAQEGKERNVSEANKVKLIVEGDWIKVSVGDTEG